MTSSLFTMPGAVILTVDDTAANLKLLRVVLSGIGATVMAALSAEEAWEQLATTVPDVILLDIVMPEMDGFTLCQKIKVDPRLAQIPIIFLSGLSDTADKVQAFTVGGADYINKPFQPIEVLARVSHHYKMMRMQQALKNERDLLVKMNEQLLSARRETVNVFEAMAEQMCGKLLDNKYLLEARIGFGGFAVVYKARHLTTQQMVAVKILRPAHPERTKDLLRRFRQESLSASRIRHSSVTTVLDTGISSDGIFYLVMELLRGHPLSDELQSYRPLPVERCLQILIPVCEVLVEAHSMGVLHRAFNISKPPTGELVKLG